jgi:hypothetical protein
VNADELKSRIAGLPQVEGFTYWSYKRREFRRNVEALDLNNFLNWPAVGITMHLGAWPWVEYELLALMKERPNWLWIKEDDFGGIEFFHGVDPSLSPNSVHMAYHLLQWEKATGLKIQDMQSIVEFGGGFGSMCKLIHRLGFKGKYVIYDFPEFAALQEYYLSNLLPPGYQIQWASLPPALPKTTDLWLATWSFSEMPVAERPKVIERTRAKSYLIGYQDVFEWGDNIAWFEEWSRAKPDYEWKTQPLDHQDGKHYYLFGVKK